LKVTKLIITTLIILTLSLPAISATPAQHLIVVDYIGECAESPQQAFLVGLGSHVILDYIRPYKFDIFALDGSEQDIITLEGLVSSYLVISNWNNVNKRWAYIGAMAPDIIEGILVLNDPQRWQRGENFFPWHQYNGRESMTKTQTMGMTVTLFALNVAF